MNKQIKFSKKELKILLNVLDEYIGYPPEIRKLWEKIFDWIELEKKTINEKTKLKDYESICYICKKIYDRREDSKEIKESGKYIYSRCWNKKE